jgi:SOS-response transcriptional repressor LexA
MSSTILHNLHILRMPTNPPINDIIEFAKLLVGESYGWKKRFSERMGMSSQQLNDILTERSPIGARIRERLNEIGFKERKENTDLPLETIPLMRIPVFNYIRAGGKAMVLRDTPSDHIITKKSNDESLFAVVVKGDSMASGRMSRCYGSGS